MGEFVRKWVSKRLQKAQAGDIGKLAASMRQLGVGTSGGAEALALFHQAVYDVWKGGRASKD